MTQTASGTKERNEEIVTVLRRFSAAFNSHDTDSFMSTWDETAEKIVYQPEELRFPILSLSALREYFDNVPNVVRRMHDIRVIDFEIDVEGDVAMVYVRFWCRIAFAKVPETVDGQIRQSFILKRRGEEWKLAHYHESRQAPGFERAVGEW
ncbi:MAG: nuclear transport factor 2 family protein [Actinobacteria bacterium]|nr:nuclear transport factor 2 family protein [Actinomycetota bacterium]